MMRKRLRILAPLLLLVAALVAPVPASATSYTVNLAGRPIDGSAVSHKFGSDCHGTAYGRVAGDMVLFTAAHCRQDSQKNDSGYPFVYAQNGQLLGHWTSVTAADDHDLTYIILSSGQWPSVRNVVYSNNGSGGYTITAQPSSAIDCANYPGNEWLHQAFQTSSTSTYGPNDTGFTEGFWTGGAGNCEVATTTLSHAPSGYKDSGSPFILLGSLHTVFALGTSRNALTNEIIVTPLYEGLADLKAYYAASTVYLCTSATCP